MSEHTPEPWQCLPGRPHTMQHIQTEDGEHIGTFSKRSDMERAAACVNACAGIDDPAQYIAVARRLADDAEVILDLNEAMENALRECLAVLHPGVVGLIGNYHGDAASAEAARAVNNAKAAIAKMETAACLT